MKILLINLPGELVRGGAEVVVAQTARLLRARSHAVAILDHAGELPELGVEAMRADEDRALARAREFRAEYKPEIIHLHNLASRKLLAELAREAGVCRTFHDVSHACVTGKLLLPDGNLCAVHDCLRTCTLRLGPRRWLRYQRLTALNRRIPALVPSEFLRDVYRRADYTKLTVLPHAYEEVSEPDTDGEPLVLFIGRLQPEKGLDDFLALATHLPPTVRLAISGDGDARARVEAAARELGDRLLVDDGRDPQRRSELLCRCRVVVMPSRQPESFGLVGFLAARYGKPVVAYDCGGIREWLAPEQLVPRGDLAALGRKVGDLLGDPERAARVGRNARDDYRRRFGEAAYTDRLLKFYDGVRRR